MYAAPARYECVKQLKRARRGLDLRLTIEAGKLLMLIWCELMHINYRGSRDNLKMFKYEFVIVHQCQSDFTFRSIHEFVMFLFTVHARELLNLPGHGLGLDASRKSRIRSEGFLERKHGVLLCCLGKKKSLTCCCLQQSILWKNKALHKFCLDVVFMVTPSPVSHSVSAGGGAGW